MAYAKMNAVHFGVAGGAGCARGKLGCAYSGVRPGRHGSVRGRRLGRVRGEGLPRRHGALGGGLRLGVAGHRRPAGALYDAVGGGPTVSAWRRGDVS